MAYSRAREAIERTGNLPVPIHLRNAPTGLLKQMGYGKGYKYAHDFEGAKVDQQHLPDELRDARFYEPTDRDQ
jgi:putative ATPase